MAEDLKSYNKYINEILFSGDKVLLADTEGHLQENITKLNKIPKLYDRRISANKTEVISLEGKYSYMTRA
jgi:hypothetical protein